MGGGLDQGINELVQAMMRRIKSATDSDGIGIFVVGQKEKELDVYSLDCQLATGTFKETTQTSFADRIATYVLRTGKHWTGTREQVYATFPNDHVAYREVCASDVCCRLHAASDLLVHSVCFGRYIIRTVRTSLIS